MIADWMLDPNFKGPPYGILENDSDTSSGEDSSCEEWWIDIPKKETELLVTNSNVVTNKKKPGIFKWLCNFFHKEKATVAKSQTFVSIISNEYEAMVNAMQVTVQSGIGRSNNQEVAINPVMTGELSTENSFHSYVCSKHAPNLTKTHRFSNTIRPLDIFGKVFTTVRTADSVPGPSISVLTTSASGYDETSIEDATVESFNIEFDQEWADLISKNQKKEASNKKPKNY